jgi:hypothetical protein
VKKLFVIVILLSLFACKNDDSVTYVDNSQRYFPIFEGKEWIDSIQRIWIDAPSNVYDTSIIVYKTNIDSIVEEGNAKKIYCTTYQSENGNWTVDHVFWYEMTQTQLLRFEDNMLWLDLVFPLTLGKEWNPYAYTIYSDTLLRNTVQSVNKMKVIHNVPYDSTLTIYHEMDSTLIYKYTDVSTYAAGYGFLKKDKVSIVSDDPNFDYTLPIEQRIKTAQLIRIKRVYSYE